MPTLSAMFKLYNNYTPVANQITQSTTQATNSIMKASGATNTFNNSLAASGVAAKEAGSGLGKFLSIAALVASAIKGMSISDEYMNTSARLDLINDGLQTQAELQDKIFTAADRSKGAYTDMANAVAKLGLLSGDTFSSNDELIGFTELLQKSFKVGGASSMEQSSALLQLTQAMASGKLQGDEFRSIMENAPMLADAIAKYTGKSKGELKKMSAEGTITADIIKNALFAAGDDINKKFATMPLTFADVWNKIKNGGIKAFSGLISKINKLINTPEFMNFVNHIIFGFDLAAKAASWLIDVIINGWSVIGPILGLIATVYLASMIIKLWAMIPPLIAQAAAWLGVYWPILLVIGIIALAVFAARKFGASWEQIISAAGGIIGALATHVYNDFAYMWNGVAAFINFFGNVFKNPAAAIDTLILDLANNVIGYVLMMAKSIEDLLNGIPGLKVDITSGITDLRDRIADKASEIRDEAGLIEYAKTLELMTPKEGYNMGSKIGSDIYNSINDAFNNLTNALKGTEYDPTIIEGTGVNGKVDVKISNEDIQYLRDLAEREYINKFSTATLAPNISVKFGDVHETTDVDKVTGRIRKILQEEIATASEGVN